MKHIRMIICTGFIVLLAGCSGGRKSIEASNKAIQALKKVQAMIDVGPTYRNFGGAVAEAKTTVDEALPDVSNEQLKKEIADAMETYIDSNKLWNQIATQNSIRKEDGMGKVLTEKYGIFINPVWDMYFSEENQQALLKEMWTKAKQHLDKAIAISSGK